MTKTERKQTIMRAFFSFVLIAVLAVAMVIGGGFIAPTAYAATNDDLQFDETYVMVTMTSLRNFTTRRRQRTKQYIYFVIMCRSIILRSVRNLKCLHEILFLRLMVRRKS